MNGVMLPPINEAIERRIRDGLSVVLAVPTGYTITETMSPGQTPEPGLTLTANPLRLWMVSEPECAWFVQNGEWVPFSAPPCVATLGEIVATAWGVQAPYTDELHRYGSLSAWVGRTDAEEAEVLELDAKLRAAGVHPDWPILPRETIP